MNPKTVGTSARSIAEGAGIHVPADHPCKVLIGMADPSKISKTYPMSLEKLSPVLGLFKAKNFEEAVEISKTCIHLAGKGHTGSIHTRYDSYDKIKYYTEHI